MNLFFGILALYIVGNLLFYIGSRFHYAVYSTLLRKGLYTLFIVGLLFGVLSNQIDYTNWKFLIQMAAVMVFIDLSIFQTPNIIKIWSAEFQHADTIETNIRENEERIQFMNRKANVFTKIIQEAEDDLTSIPMITTQESYELQLTEFIEKYTNEFDFTVRIHFLPDDLEQVSEIKHGILNSLSHIENLFNLTIKNKDEVQQSLYDAKTYAFESEKHAVIPIFDGNRNYLIILSTNEGHIIETDLLNIINLVTIFNWAI